MYDMMVHQVCGIVVQAQAGSGQRAPAKGLVNQAPSSAVVGHLRGERLPFGSRRVATT